MGHPVAIVIGASRGIGAATAHELAARGFHVVLSARKAEACEDVRASIESAEGSCEVASCDATIYGDVETLIDGVVKRRGRLDCLINNAGTMDPIGRIEDCDADEWTRGASINLFTAFHGCRAVLPHFKENGAGVIVNLSTGAAFHPLVGWSAYCASKAGLAMFTRILGQEVDGTGIRVYGFQPGMVNTSMTRQGLKVKVNRVSELDPKNFSDPSVPARAIAWLCQERPEDISGGEVDINAPEFRERASLGA